MPHRLKYALALDLDDPGFHHSVLTDFRDRLCEDDRADQLLSLSLTRMREAGMVAERGRQRTDSTQVLAAARDLTRVELVLEAVRAVLEEAAQRAPDNLDGLVDAEWPPATGVQSDSPVSRVTLSPGSSRRERTPAGSSSACRTTGVGLARKRCDRSSCRTSSSTPVAGYVLAPRGTDSPKEPCGSSSPTTVKPAGPSAAIPAGADIWSMSPRPARPALSNLITDIATTGPTRDTEALPGIYIRLRERGLLPRQHLLDGGCLSVSLLHRSLRDHQVELVGPVKASAAWQSKEQTGFTRDDFTIDFDQRQVICPNGETSHIWLEPPAMAPYTVARFRPYQCNPCPDRPACARGTAARTVNFLPQHLHELQAQNRANQQDSQWRRLYATRSGVEGTICEFINGHRARRSRYRGHRKTHVQHVLTGIAINIERLASRTTRHPHRP